MKRTVLITIIFSIFITAYSNAEKYELSDTFTKKMPFVLFDFDDQKPLSGIKGRSGIFDFDPNDELAYCREAYVKDKDLHKDGFNLKLTYSVLTNKPAYNGWWTRLNGCDISRFEAISLKIKGDKTKGFSDIFKIELKDKVRKVEYIIEDVTDKWRTVIIPLDSFYGDDETMNWSNMFEMVMIFEDWRLKVKQGRYFIDDIQFIPRTGEEVRYAEILKKDKDIKTVEDTSMKENVAQLENKIIFLKSTADIQN